MRKKYIIILLLATLLLVILFMFKYIHVINDQQYRLDVTNKIFKGNFRALCNNLNVQPSEDVYNENIKFAYVCFSIINLTSFNDNTELNSIVHALYDMSERKELYNVLNKDIIDKLNKFSLYLEDEALLKDIYDYILNFRK